MIEITLNDGVIIFLSKESSIYIDKKNTFLGISGFEKPFNLGKIIKYNLIGEDKEEKAFYDHFMRIMALK